MKVIVVFATLFAVSTAAPQGAAPPGNSDKDATVVKYDSENIGTDGYKYSVETSNGISISEEGTLQNAGAENEAISVRGSFTWTSPDGKSYTVTYIADENGFQPQGEHLPQVPTGAGAPPGAAPGGQPPAAPQQ